MPRNPESKAFGSGEITIGDVTVLVSGLDFGLGRVDDVCPYCFPNGVRSRLAVSSCGTCLGTGTVKVPRSKRMGPSQGTAEVTMTLRPTICTIELTEPRSVTWHPSMEELFLKLIAEQRKAAGLGDV